MNEKNIRIVYIKRFDVNGEVLGHYCQPESEANVILDEIKEAEIGAKWEIELIEIPQEDFDQMPEFPGY